MILRKVKVIRIELTKLKTSNRTPWMKQLMKPREITTRQQKTSKSKS